MSESDKDKLKVLIKMILIQKSPKYLTAKQISNIINQYTWGFKSDVNSRKVGRLLKKELRKSGMHFMMDIECKKGKDNIFTYRMPKEYV